jgi:hypothetical protein
MCNVTMTKNVLTDGSGSSNLVIPHCCLGMRKAIMEPEKRC